MKKAKKALVVSFPRSGTHFLMNTLALNFGYINKHANVEPLGYNLYAPENFLWVLCKLDGSYDGQTMLKSHHEIWFMESVMHKILEHFEVFYIARDGEPVLKSYHRHIKGLPWVEGPRTETWEKFAEAMPIGGMLRYQCQQYPSMAEKHKSHVIGWLNSSFSDRIHYIKYEDLDLKFEETVKKIGEDLNITPRKIVRPSRDKNVVKDGQIVRCV